tara:strand:- start:536 stop:853 length:318 start_codon:yes stop_codon:yes gene_type:complete
MPFSVTSFTAGADENIVSLDWVYTNVDGALSNVHRLAVPAGSVVRANVTQEILVGWLEDQLQNTADEFDTAISNAKAQAEYQSGCKHYSLEENNTYAITPEVTVD